ncbi:glycosyltransferase family 2 protein [Candidatus Roizmanbacteria bacterium]|nr:glycosyltransferase family 2 protein [Candidatus Roizmanbacteria bacterium]
MLSVVVPVFNEKESLSVFFAELVKVLSTLAKEYEIIFIDDGSTDNSLEILKGFEKKNKHVKVFAFRKNLGKAEALTFGFIKAKGDYIVTLDADLQDQPSEIHKLLSKAKNGVEVVCGWRKDRKDKSRMKIISKIFNFFVNYFFSLQLHDYNCGLKVYTRDAAKSLRLYGGLHRFIPLLVHQQGFIVNEVVVDHQSRKLGKSKYGFSKIWKDLPDMFTMLFLVKYSKRPLHFFGIAGGLLLIFGLGIFIYLSWLWFGGHSIGRRPLFFTSILLIISGLQVFFTGFLADLMLNIAQNAQSQENSHLHFPLKYSSR